MVSGFRRNDGSESVSALGSPSDPAMVGLSAAYHRRNAADIDMDEVGARIVADAAEIERAIAARCTLNSERSGTRMSIALPRHVEGYSGRRRPSIAASIALVDGER